MDFEDVSSQVSAYFFNKLPLLFKYVPTLMAFKTSRKCFLDTHSTLYNVNQFFHSIGKPIYWLTGPDPEVRTRLACEMNLE